MAIALRGTGRRTYTTAPVAAAAVPAAIPRARRYAPIAPTPKDPTTSSVSAMPTWPSSAVPNSGHQPERGRTGRGGAQVRMSPRGGELGDEVLDPRPLDERADRGHAVGEQVAGPDQHQREDAQQGVGRGAAEQVHERLEGVPGAITDRLQAIVRVVLAEERAEARRGTHLQLAELRVVDRTTVLSVATGAPDGPEMEQRPPPGTEPRERRPSTPRREIDDGFQQRQHEAERHDPQQRPERVGAEHDTHAAARDVALVRDVGFAALIRGLVVTPAGVGCDHHASAGEPRPPAQVEILRSGERLGVEPFELAEEIGAHEHRRARDVEDVADRVVLLLVDLARFDAGVRSAEPVDGSPDLQQDVGLVGAHELRSDDGCVGAVRLLDHDPDRAGIECDVVVADQEERRAVDCRECFVRRAAEAHRRTDASDEGARERGADPGGRVAVRPGIDHQDRRAPGTPDGRARPAPPRGTAPGCA